MIDNVLEFHIKFDLPQGDSNILMGDFDAQMFRAKFLLEEIEEFCDAVDSSDWVGAFDALLDLAYVTYGTALFMGITPDQWKAGMEAVHAANMSKERALCEEESNSKTGRGSKFDVVKPEGWEGPEGKLLEILSWEK